MVPQVMKTRTGNSFTIDFKPHAWSLCSCVMRMASMPSGSSPIESNLFAISFRLIPASIRRRPPSVFTKVAFPRLPLPSTETVTAIPALSPIHRTGQGNCLISFGDTERADAFVQVRALDTQDTRGAGNVPLRLIESFQNSFALGGIASLL